MIELHLVVCWFKRTIELDLIGFGCSLVPNYRKVLELNLFWCESRGE